MSATRRSDRTDDPGGYSSRARERARRRKSKWNLILFPLAIGGVGVSWYAFLRLLVACRNLVLPQHQATLEDLLRSDCREIAAIVFLVSPLFAAIPGGLLLCNGIAWCIPPARRAFEKEAEGVRHASFADARRDLLLVARYVVPVALAFAFGAGLLLRCPR